MYKIEREDLAEKAYEALKLMILRGELPSGEKLLQESLAENLGISRTPLCSALAKLEKEMLVTSLPRRGFYVNRLSLKELLDIYDIRLRLEPLGAGEAAERASASQIADLESAVNPPALAGVTENYRSFKEYDYRFHSLVMEISGNSFLSRMIRSFNIISLGNMQHFFKSPEQSIAEHRSLIEAIKHHDKTAAEKTMYTHIVHARQVIEKKLREENG
ncbi:MAG: GntR family transcriptional regulator [Spirochaetales bacterium]|nr:GntR family transcriptional regulator [Spirochaetales bacterium]